MFLHANIFEAPSSTEDIKRFQEIMGIIEFSLVTDTL